MENEIDKLKEAESLLEEHSSQLDQMQIERARKSFIHFCEYVIKDESTGNRIKLAELQKTWIYHIAFCKKYSLNALILAPMSSGKCVGPDTVFQTQDGEVLAKELQVSDSVLSYDGQNLVWQKVSAIEIYEKPTMRVETASGRSTVVSHDHPFLCNGKWVEAQDLRPNKDAIMVATGWDVDDPLTNLSKNNAYILGVLLGKEFNSDYKHLAESTIIIGEYADSNDIPFNAKFYKDNPDYVKSILTSFKHSLVDDIETVLGKLFLHSTPVVESFIAGYFDSAGRYDNKLRVFQLYGKMYENCSYLLKFLNRAGFDGIIKRRITDKGVRHYVELHRFANDEFFTLDINMMRLVGKSFSAVKTKRGNRLLNDTVRVVEDTGVGTTYGVEIENTHTHVTDGFITHNTQIISVALPLYLLGRNPNTRVKLVCLSDDSAKERVSSIRGYIENDADYNKVFPHVKPGDKTEWTRHKLIVERQTHAKDATIDAKGIVASAIGGRADVLIVDDIFDQRTAVSQPSTREQYLSTYTQVWLSRVEPNGRVVCICTRWHEQDLAGYIMADPIMINSYGILIQRVSDDFSGINCEVHIPDKLVEYYKKENPLTFRPAEY